MGDDERAAVLPGPDSVDAVLALARRARDLADRTADTATRARSVDGVDWRSAAAEQFRDELRACCGLVDSCAAALDDVAAALVRHADSAGERLDVLQAAARVAADLGEVVGRTAGRVLSQGVVGIAPRAHR